MQDYHQLEIWSRSMEYAVAIHGFVTQLPESERYNLASQLQRAVTSVPLNIAEGSASSTRAEFARFLGYADQAFARPRISSRRAPRSPA
jgi:four helix bundle protein